MENLKKNRKANQIFIYRLTYRVNAALHKFKENVRKRIKQGLLLEYRVHTEKPCLFAWGGPHICCMIRTIPKLF